MVLVGGGKTVLQGSKGNFDRIAIFAPLPRRLRDEAEPNITTEDVGTTVKDMNVVGERTRLVAGLHAAPGKAGGALHRGRRAAYCIHAAVAEDRVAHDLQSMTVAVESAGNVGAGLCRLPKSAGAQLIVTDINITRAGGRRRRDWMA